MGSQVYFSTNPADWEKVPGVSVSERTPPGFVRGADLSTVGFVGKTVRGPLHPVDITSPAQFFDVFGGRGYDRKGGTLQNDVWQALVERPFGRIVVRRVAASDAAVGFNVFTQGAIEVLRVEASSVGSWPSSGRLSAEVKASSDGNADHFDLVVSYNGEEKTYANLDLTPDSDNLAEVLGDEDSNLVSLIKLDDGRPDNSSLDIDGGDDGTLAGTDYDAGLEDIAAYQGVTMVLPVGGRAFMSSINAKANTLAANAYDRIFLLWSGEYDQSVNAEKTDFDASITTRTDRIVWCYNHGEQRDPETGVLMDIPSSYVKASILANTDVDVHPGLAENARFASSFRRLKRTLSRDDLIALRNHGIASLEKTPEGFVFRDSVTTDLTPGKTELTRRRMTDFLQISASSRLRNYVKQKSTRTIRGAMAAELKTFSQGLQDDERIIEEFAIEQDSVNTKDSRSRGVEKLFWKVRLIGHMLYVVLETSIGTGVVVESE